MLGYILGDFVKKASGQKICLDRPLDETSSKMKEQRRLLPQWTSAGTVRKFPDTGNETDDADSDGGDAVVGNGIDGGDPGVADVDNGGTSGEAGAGRRTVWQATSAAAGSAVSSE
jgi:hypothetical protein